MLELRTEVFALDEDVVCCDWFTALRTGGRALLADGTIVDDKKRVRRDRLHVALPTDEACLMIPAHAGQGKDGTVDNRGNEWAL